ncbi:MAG TPA: hypothetical protein VGA50_13595 [Kiloniellales bacterium]|jgi:hypothetical protein
MGVEARDVASRVDHDEARRRAHDGTIGLEAGDGAVAIDLRAAVVDERELSGVVDVA